MAYITQENAQRNGGACIALPLLEAMAIPGLPNPFKTKAPVRSAFIHAQWSTSQSLDTLHFWLRF